MFQWTILVRYEIVFWTAAMTVWLWISGENKPIWRVRPISCRFSFPGQQYRLALPAVIEMYYVSSFWCVLWHFLDQHGETDHFDWLFCQRSAVGYMCKQLYMYMWIGLKTPSALKWTRKWSESSLSELIMWTQRKHSFIMGTVVFTLNKITAVWQTPYKITQINKIKLANVCNRLECISFRCHLNKLEPDDYLCTCSHMCSSVHFKRGLSRPRVFLMPPKILSHCSKFTLKALWPLFK